MKDHSRRIRAIDKKLYSGKKTGLCIIEHHIGEPQEELDRRVRELREENIKMYGSCGPIIILDDFSDLPTDKMPKTH